MMLEPIAAKRSGYFYLSPFWVGIQFGDHLFSKCSRVRCQMRCAVSKMAIVCFEHFQTTVRFQQQIKFTNSKSL